MNPAAKPTMPAEVELRPAHAWDCEACGRENFCGGVVAEFSQEDRAELTEFLGEKPITGEWMTKPDTVTCAYCGAEFGTKGFRDEP